jgi:hypothetical protein
MTWFRIPALLAALPYALSYAPGGFAGIPPPVSAGFKPELA